MAIVIHNNRIFENKDVTKCGDGWEGHSTTVTTYLDICLIGLRKYAVHIVITHEHAWCEGDHPDYSTMIGIYLFPLKLDPKTHKDELLAIARERSAEGGITGSFYYGREQLAKSDPLSLHDEKDRRAFLMKLVGETYDKRNKK